MASTWSIHYKMPNFRDMRSGIDYEFTDVTGDGILVDVPLLTYNHAKYIRQAIESVLNQKTQYRYRILIADDCSTDGTTDIIREYQRQYPDKIATLIWKHNVGVHCNTLMMDRLADSKYHATLEGDDYWTDDKKLEKSISFLEENPDYVAFAHNIRIVDEDGKLLHKRDGAYLVYAMKEEFVFPEDNIKNYYLWQIRYLSQTGGIVNRNFKKKWRESDWDAQMKCRDHCDVVRGLCLAYEGKAYFSRDIMAAYRRIYSGTSFTAHAKRAVLKNDSLNEYLRNRDLDEFSQTVYGKELACMDNMAKEALGGATYQLCLHFTPRNLGIYFRIVCMECARKLLKGREKE